MIYLLVNTDYLVSLIKIQRGKKMSEEIQQEQPKYRSFDGDVDLLESKIEQTCSINGESPVFEGEMQFIGTRTNNANGTADDLKLGLFGYATLKCLSIASKVTGFGCHEAAESVLRMSRDKIYRDKKFEEYETRFAQWWPAEQRV